VEGGDAKNRFQNVRSALTGAPVSAFTERPNSKLSCRGLLSEKVFFGAIAEVQTVLNPSEDVGDFADLQTGAASQRETMS
jgi:hypothetical protein